MGSVKWMAVAQFLAERGSFSFLVWLWDLPHPIGYRDNVAGT
jgi:hypothetical protein